MFEECVGRKFGVPLPGELKGAEIQRQVIAETVRNGGAEQTGQGPE